MDIRWQIEHAYDQQPPLERIIPEYTLGLKCIILAFRFIHEMLRYVDALLILFIKLFLFASRFHCFHLQSTTKPLFGNAFVNHFDPLFSLILVIAEICKSDLQTQSVRFTNTTSASSYERPTLRLSILQFFNERRSRFRLFIYQQINPHDCSFSPAEI